MSRKNKLINEERHYYVRLRVRFRFMFSVSVREGFQVCKNG